MAITAEEQMRDDLNAVADRLLQRAVEERLAKVDAHLDDHEREKLRDVLFMAGRKWGELTSDEIIEAFEIAGFKIMTDDALRRYTDEQCELRASDI